MAAKYNATALDKKVLRFIAQHPRITITAMYSSTRIQECAAVTKHRPVYVLQSLGMLAKAGLVIASNGNGAMGHNYDTEWSVAG